MRLPTTLLLVAACALPIGCSRSDGPDTPTSNGGSEAPSRAALETRIEAVTDVNGTITIDLPLGTENGIETGMLLRVYDPTRPGYIKGMLQVVGMPSKTRSQARQIGLMDRNSPLAVDDPVREIKDLASLNPGSEVERVTEEALIKGRELDAQEMERFQELREHFAKELTKAVEQQRAEREWLMAQHAKHLEQATTDHARALERKDAEHLAELSAVRTTLIDETNAGLKKERDRYTELVRSLEGKRAEQDQQLLSLAAENLRLTEKVNTLLKESDQLHKDKKRELAAEVETRQVLELRIRELEQRLGLPGTSSVAVLTNLPGRNETVIEQLDRVTRERDEFRRQLGVVQERLEALNLAIAQDEAVAAVASERDSIADTLKKVEQDRKGLEDAAAASELRRLQAEQAYYQLSIRVMELPKHIPSVSSLQGRLRAALAAENDLPPKPAAPTTTGVPSAGSSPTTTSTGSGS